MLYKKPLFVAVNSRFTHSNPAVYCLKSYLKSCGLHADLMEFNINGQVLDMLSAIVEYKPDIVGFSCYIWNVKMIGTLTKMLKKVLPECKILWGGPEVNASAEKWFAEHKEIDFVIEGEGELPWQKLLEKAEKDTDFSDVPNLLWKKTESEIVKNPKGDYVDLSLIPFYYDEEDLRDLKNRIIYYESSRGCPFGCKFCVSSTEPVRYRDLELIKSDLQKLVACGCKKIKFVDRTFNSNKKRTVEILEYLLSLYHPSLCFHLELEPMCLDSSLVDILTKAPAGYFQAEIGVQSLYDPALKAVGRKNLTAESTELIKKLLANDNIHIHLDLIGGLPYETLSEFKNSFDGLYKIFPHYLQLGFLKILPGTPLADKAEVYGLDYVDEPPYQVLQTKWLSYDDMQELSATEHAVDDYYNEMFFEETLKIAVDEWQKSGKRPFEFFNQLGKADLAIDGGKNQYQKAEILLSFIKNQMPNIADLVTESIKVDFTKAKMHLPAFVEQIDGMSILKEKYDGLLSKMPELETLPKRKWLKKYQVFEIKCDVGDLTRGVYAADLENTVGIWQRPVLIKLD